MANLFYPFFALDESMKFLISTILELSPRSGIAKDDVDHPNAVSDHSQQLDPNVDITNQPDTPKNALCCT